MMSEQIEGPNKLGTEETEGSPNTATSEKEWHSSVEKELRAHMRMKM